MKTNPEHIPSEIFDWMEKHSFAALNSWQQNTVLQHLPAEEYDALHTACTSIHSVQQKESRRSETIKNNLMERFDEVHTKIKAPVSAPIIGWKAAAALLALGFISVLVLLIRQSSAALSSTVSSTDTIYIRKEVQSTPLVSYDTVIMEKVIYKQKDGRQEPQEFSTEEPNVPAPVNDEKLNTVTIRELESTLNSSRGNSMKDDSLQKKYGFNTL